jgi:uncharacterized membrane protein YccF (DUF307 family)
MSLIPCPECNENVSDQAPNCPKCGHPISKSVEIEESTQKIDKEKVITNEPRSDIDIEKNVFPIDVDSLKNNSNSGLRTFLNICWFVFGGGFFMGILWWIVGLLMYITVIGIPFGKSCFVIGNFSFHPFGRETINRKLITGKKDIGTGGLGLIVNILWFIIGGIWLFIGHFSACIVSFIGIITIPFAFQHWKLAKICLAPIGKTVVLNSVAEKIREIRGIEEINLQKQIKTAL